MEMEIEEIGTANECIQDYKDQYPGIPGNNNDLTNGFT